MKPEKEARHSEVFVETILTNGEERISMVVELGQLELDGKVMPVTQWHTRDGANFH